MIVKKIKLKKVIYWYCPECDNTYNSKNAVRKKTGGFLGMDVVTSYCPFCKTKNTHSTFICILEEEVK